MAKERVKAWNILVGPVSTQELVTMCDKWNIPFGDITDKKIKPELIKEMLDFYVIGQDNYKKKLSVAYYNYFINSKEAGLILPKSNLLVCGPSGSGKTYGMQVLSKLFHVPFVLVHCNSLVQEGIVGPGLTDGFTELLTQGWQKEELEHAVVCFDEFDKLFEKTDGESSGSYNARVVNEMLNIIDDKGEVDFKMNFINSDGNRMKIPSRKMMFVFTGVFDGLRKKKEKTKVDQVQDGKERKIGFRSIEERENETKAKEAKPALVIDDEPALGDFIEFGVKPEMLGRIQNFVFLDELKEDELVALFKMGTSSPFREFEQYFSYNDISSVLTEEGMHTLAKLAIEKKLGVRGLKSLLQQVLMEDMYDLEVGEDRHLEITKQYILDNLKKK
jgi:ATP-dependent Clp protease ATP-binding subunit ClpX